MRSTKLFVGSTVVAIVVLTALSTATRASAQQETVLFSFNENNTGDGISPSGTLVFDTAGNLYGTTFEGGANGEGTVYELSPSAGGGWTQKVLHSFTDNGVDGIVPTAGLILDASGNLYGTTTNGGAHICGTVFELKPSAHGNWTEKILYSFTCDNASEGSSGNLIFDAAGNLYGTTYGGGTYNHGSVFELSPLPGGGWVEKTLHSFNNNGTDGYYLSAPVVMDAAGDLYGTTGDGGTYNYGIVFQLKPTSGRGWAEKILHNFNNNGTDGYNSFRSNGVVLDAAGNLYGATFYGGASQQGVVFELRPSAGGVWSEKILHAFVVNGTDGEGPTGGLLLGSSGKLYGITEFGGSHGIGTLFEMTPAPGGNWQESLVYTFNGEGIGAYFPNGGLVTDSSGNLYGTSQGGGAYAAGTVFEMKP